MAKSSIIKIYGVECSRLELDEYLKHGARLTNYDPGKMALFGNNWRDGAIGYVTGPLADELAQKHDAWNFRVWKLRLAGDIDVCQRKPTTDEERQANIAYQNARKASAFRPGMDVKCAIGCKTYSRRMNTSTSTSITKRRCTSKAGIDGMIKLSRLFASGNVPYASHDNPKIAEIAIAHMQLGEWIKTGNLYPASAYRHVIQGSDDAEAVGAKLEGMLQ